LSRIKTLDGPRVCGISPVGEEKVYGQHSVWLNYVCVYELDFQFKLKR